MRRERREKKHRKELHYGAYWTSFTCSSVSSIINFSKRSKFMMNIRCRRTRANNSSKYNAGFFPSHFQNSLGSFSLFRRFRPSNTRFSVCCWCWCDKEGALHFDDLFLVLCVSPQIIRLFINFSNVLASCIVSGVYIVCGKWWRASSKLMCIFYFSYETSKLFFMLFLIKRFRVARYRSSQQRAGTSWVNQIKNNNSLRDGQIRELVEWFSRF